MIRYGTPRRRWAPIVDRDVARIPLSQGHWAEIDAPDLHLVAPYAWGVNHGANTSYAVTYVARRIVSMHRLLTDAPRELVVDHIDRNGLNNRRANFRLCTHKQNTRRRISGTGTTAFKGVAFHRHSGLYHATINVDGRQLSLRYHQTAELAARAYDAAARSHFGEFALTNEELGLLQ